MKIQLPVRFTGEQVQEFNYTTLTLNSEKTAFLLIDCDGDCGPSCNPVVELHIAPTLAACRAIGVRPVYLYNESWPNGPQDMVYEIHHTRRGRPSVSDPVSPSWAKNINPHQGDLVIGKKGQSGFIGSDLDKSLKDCGIDTLLTVGFSFKSCLFYTLVDAFQYNYRVVFLRDGTDPQGTNEFPDTKDEALPEKGWVRIILTRLIEDHLGYSSTCNEVIKSCERVSDLQQEDAAKTSG